MTGETAPDRSILQVTGEEAAGFLQGLVSNDVKGLENGLVYAALLNPQGKYLVDFFLVPSEDGILIDVASEFAADLKKRLTMYKLRAKVQIDALDMPVTRGLGATPDGAHPDPRHDALGWRAYGETGSAPEIDWDALRIEHLIPETGIELIADQTYLLEAGFERLNGVDFRKGCYVGQEVTARMKHKTELRKGLARVTVSEPVAPGTEITSDSKPAGSLYTNKDGAGIAYLRFDRAKGSLKAGPATLTYPA